MHAPWAIQNVFAAFCFLLSAICFLIVGTKIAIYSPIMPFLFENLEVYKKSLEFVGEIHEFCSNLSSIRNGKIIDQLQRAALSIPLNIAEGNGRIHAREKRQFFYISRGSLLECIPLLQICLMTKLLDKSKYESLYTKADEIGRMLNGLIRSVEN